MNRNSPIRGYCKKALGILVLGWLTGLPLTTSATAGRTETQAPTHAWSGASFASEAGMPLRSRNQIWN